MWQSYKREMQLQQQEQYDKTNAQANAYNTMPHSGGIGSNDLGVMPVTIFWKLLGYLGMFSVMASIVLTQMSHSVSEIAFFGQYGIDNMLLFIYGSLLIVIRVYHPLMAMIIWSTAALFAACALVLGEWGWLIISLTTFGFGFLMVKLIVKKH